MSTINFNDMKTTMIIDNVNINHIDIIREYFVKYNIGKINDIAFYKSFVCSDNGYVIIELDEWYNNKTSENMYERMVNYGEVRLVYNDPQYFIMKFYNIPKHGEEYLDRENKIAEETPDYREEYLDRENTIKEETPDYREDYLDRENTIAEETPEYREVNMMDISVQLENIYTCFSDVKKEVKRVTYLQNRMHKELKKIKVVKLITPIHKRVYKKNKHINVWARRLRNNIVS